MLLQNYFVSSNIMLALFSIATNVATFELGTERQHPLQKPRTGTHFNIGFSLQTSYGAAAIIFEGLDGTLETYTRTYEAGYLYQQVMAKLSLKSSQHVAYVLHLYSPSFLNLQIV